MTALFLELFNRSISVSYLVIVIILLRFIWKRAPKVFYSISWGLCAFRLVFSWSMGDWMENTEHEVIPLDGWVDERKYDVNTLDGVTLSVEKFSSRTGDYTKYYFADEFEIK